MSFNILLEVVRAVKRMFEACISRYIFTEVVTPRQNVWLSSNVDCKRSPFAECTTTSTVSHCLRLILADGPEGVAVPERSARRWEKVHSRRKWDNPIKNSRIITRIHEGCQHLLGIIARSHVHVGILVSQDTSAKNATSVAQQDVVFLVHLETRPCHRTPTIW